jgi:thiol:disulfide interchange protein DsbA
VKNKRLVVGAAIVAAIICVVLLALFFTRQPDGQGSASALQATLIEGTHYRELSTPLEIADNGVSVIEFFWYGCPHCRDFEPRIKDWLASAPEDIAFELKPVAWNDATRLHAAMYYVGQTADRPEQLHEALFDQIIDMRQERNPDRQIELVAPLFSQHGISTMALAAAMQAPDNLARVKKAEQDMRAAEVSSTPSLLIGGKYMMLNNESVADKGMFSVLDTLVQMARQ